MSKLAQKFQGKFVSYPISNLYFLQQRLWNKKNPWVFIGNEVIFPLETKVLGTPLEIKDGTVINGPMTVKGSGNVSIGKYCGIAENLFIISSNHVFNKADIGGKFSPSVDINKGPVYIGNNVWIGDNVTILSGVTIGNGAAIGAGSVVTKNIPDFAIAVGIPAKTIKFRFTPKIIKLLLNIGWWYWDVKTINKNKEFFSYLIDKKNIDSLINNLNLESEKEVLEVNFSDNNSNNYLLDGWGSQEKEFRWILKNSAGLAFKVKRPKKLKTIIIDGNSFNSPQAVRIEINGAKIKTLVIPINRKKIKMQIKNLKKGVNYLRFFLKKGFRPVNIDQNSQDKRLLFARIYSVSLK